MFYFHPSFDWYQCTVFVSPLDKSGVRCLGCFCPEDVTFPLDYFEAVEEIALEYGGDIDVRSVPARNGWRHAVQLHHGSRVYCTISMQNSATVKNCFNVQWTGSDSNLGAEIARKLFPGHSVTRVDVAIDACFSDSVQGLSTGVVLAGCVDIAVSHRLSTTMLGDWSGRDQSGRTLYIGSTKSPIRVRVYEKGRQPDTFPQDPDWLRFEIVYRPKGQPLRQSASILTPYDISSSYPVFAEIIKTYYTDISDLSVPVRLTEVINRHETDVDRALDHMFFQYKKCLLVKLQNFDTNHIFMDWFLSRLNPVQDETQSGIQSLERKK